jgi:TatD DNase family protein
MKLIDAHCHLEIKDFPTADEVIARSKAAGLVHAVVVGQWQKPGDFGRAVALGTQWPDFLSPTMGIHPHDAAQATAEDWVTLEKLCALPEVKAVGETGLDFYYNHSPREQQADGFRRQCQLAKWLNKPLVVHVRDAHPECAAILKEEGMSKGMIHCFTGDTTAARSYLDLGFHLSISGVVTYKKTEALAEAVSFAPLGRLLIETDTPYLAPIPMRGKKNEPGYLVHTAARVAELKHVSVEEVALNCARNTVALLSLPLSLINL